jgi:hypothetical protein
LLGRQTDRYPMKAAKEAADMHEADTGRGSKISITVLLAMKSSMTFPRCFLFAGILLVASTASARAIDEIQVYNAEIAKVGQWTFQLHSNYAFIGRKEPDFPGGLIPNHALQGTGEWAWGVTEWWEMGFYTPFAVDQNLTPYSNAAKIRQLFVIPNAAEREFFYGVNFEFSYAMPQFSETRWNLEIGQLSVGARATMNSSSIRSSTLALDKMAARNSCRPPASRAISAKILRSGSSITLISDRCRTGYRSMSSNTTSMPWSISRLGVSTSMLVWDMV